MVWPHYWQAIRGSPGGTGGPGDPLASYAVYDTFTDTAGTSLDAHAPEKKPAGAAWIESLGSWEVITGGFAQCVTTAGDEQCVAVIESGLASATIEVEVTVGAATDARVVGNFVDQDNFWMGLINSSGQVILYDRTAGTFNPQDTDTFTHGNGNTYALKLVTAGDDISFYVDGVLKCSYTTAGRAHKTATKAGVSVYRATDSTSKFDNFRVAA